MFNCNLLYYKYKFHFDPYEICIIKCCYPCSKVHVTFFMFIYTTVIFKLLFNFKIITEIQSVPSIRAYNSIVYTISQELCRIIHD